MTVRFWNNNASQYEAGCAEVRNGRWYIKLGFAGFNTLTNNGNGYKERRSAERACLRLQNKRASAGQALLIETGDAQLAAEYAEELDAGDHDGAL